MFLPQASRVFTIADIIPPADPLKPVINREKDNKKHQQLALTMI